MSRLQNIAMHDYQENVTTGQTHTPTDRRQIKRIFHGVMVRIGKVEPEG